MSRNYYYYIKTVTNYVLTDNLDSWSLKWVTVEYFFYISNFTINLKQLIINW